MGREELVGKKVKTVLTCKPCREWFGLVWFGGGGDWGYDRLCKRVCCFALL